MGTSLAAAGRRTLLVDADLETGSLSDELGLPYVQGMWSAIGPDGASAQVHRTRHENLWAMPAGAAHGASPQLLSRDKLMWLLDALRNRFDAIVIDTGPLLTSIEACLVCAIADRVVVVVDRNQRIDHVRKTIDRLEWIGANCAGVVFNRAGVSDWTVFDEQEDWLARQRATELLPRPRPTMRSIDSDTVTPLGQFLSQPTVDDIDESAQRRRAA
jgi:Mrp family chromosome partitioning ATPase